MRRPEAATRTSRRARTVGTGIAGALVLASAITAPAFAADPTPAPTAASTTHAKACTPERLAAIKAKVAAAVASREAAITADAAALAARPHVTDAHRATLTGLYGSDAPALTAVNASVQSATDCAAAVTTGRTVVTGYRVFMLLGPQTRLTLAGDTGAYTATRLAAGEPAVQKAVDAIADPTKKGQAQAALDDLAAQVTKASADLSGVGDAVLALTPAQMPGSRPAIDTQRAAVKAGAAALTAAAADAKTIKGLL